jgi:hypothetical protein
LGVGGRIAGFFTARPGALRVGGLGVGVADPAPAGHAAIEQELHDFEL